MIRVRRWKEEGVIHLLLVQSMWATSQGACLRELAICRHHNFASAGCLNKILHAGMTALWSTRLTVVAATAETAIKVVSITTKEMDVAD